MVAQKFPKNAQKKKNKKNNSFFPHTHFINILDSSNSFSFITVVKDGYIRLGKFTFNCVSLSATYI